MNKIFKIFLLAYVLTILQFAFLDLLSFRNLTLDIFLVAIILFAVYKEIEDVFILSLISGIFKDALTTPHSGFYVIFYPLIGLLVAELNRIFFERQHIFFEIVIVFLSSALISFAYFLVFNPGAAGAVRLNAVILLLIPAALYNSAIYLILSSLFKKAISI